MTQMKMRVQIDQTVQGVQTVLEIGDLNRAFELTEQQLNGFNVISNP